MKGSGRPYTLIAILAAILSGCMSHHTERAADIDPSGWEPGDTVWVAFPNTDTLSARDISFIIRFNARMGHEELSLAVSVIAPDSTRFSEPVHIHPIPRSARHNDHFESVVPYRTGNTLRQSGMYMFGFSPAEEYTGLTAIGVKTDKH